MKNYLTMLFLLMLFTGEALSQSFVHPGALHSQADFDRISSNVNANEQPWRSGWEELIANPRAQLGYTPSPVPIVYRGNDGEHAENYGGLMRDAHAAYMCAVRWKVSGNTAYANKAVEIMNAWSSTLTEISGWTEQSLAAGIYGYVFANAGEIMRTYSGWSSSDFNSFKDMMLNVFYPDVIDFLDRRHNTCDTHYWSNWGLANVAASLAIGILCDRRDIYDDGIYWFTEGFGTEAIENLVPFIHSNDLGQWQESGRDQAHSLMGVGLAATICEMAWKQGDDLYSWGDHRLYKGFNYVARYNLGNSVPYTTYNNCDNVNQTSIGSNGRGELRPIWEMIYNHYANRLGWDVPHFQEYAEQMRPEGGGGDYNPNSGGYDQTGFGTLLYTLEPGSGGCNSTSITPFLQVDGGSWQSTTSVTVNSGQQVQFGPQPVSGGSWSWNGSGTSGSSREQTISPTSSGTATATHTNNCGAQSTVTFTITVNGSGGCNPTAISPALSVDGGSWQTSTSVTINSGQQVQFGPQPVSGGSWSWSGCGTSGSSREQTVSLTSTCSATATYTNDCGGQSSVTYNVTVNGSGGGSGLAGTYRLRNRATDLYLDGMGRTSNGSACGQWANTTSTNAQWDIQNYNSNYRMQNVSTGLFLDGEGETSNGSDCAMWANATSTNAQWEIEQYSGSYYRIQNVATGLYLDGMGRTSNGSALGQWANTTSNNAQWELVPVSGSRIGDSDFIEESVETKIQFYPNPASSVITLTLPEEFSKGEVKVFDLSGKMALETNLSNEDSKINVSTLESGVYVLKITGENTREWSKKFIKVKQ